MKLRIRHPRVQHPDAETVRVRIPLADSHAPAALGDALHMLVELTKPLNRLLANPPQYSKDEKYAYYLVTTFHLPDHKFIRERRFFERCVKHEVLHPSMVAYAQNVNSRLRGIKNMSTDLGHSDMRPAGSFAVVPLVLRDIEYVLSLIHI